MEALARPLWHDTTPADEWAVDRPALVGDTAVDVAIVGGGYSGLWTAYYLLRHDPRLRVVVLEAERVGFGASGRNGGWCSALLPMPLAPEHLALQRAMHDTVLEVGRVAAAEGIECDFRQGGYVAVARTAWQLERARDAVLDSRRLGLTDDDHRVLHRDEARALCNATGVVGGTFTPHCAALHPTKLVRGLATAVERLGGVVHEHTRVVAIDERWVRCTTGTVRADVVVRATEAFTPRLPGLRRANVPVYSLMLATEPLPSSVWEQIGLRERATFNDLRHNIVYGQRTADDRFAFGGRGAWYHWGSALDARFEQSDRLHDRIHRSLRDLFPTIGDATITHRWGGAVAAARDRWCHVTFDPATGMASLGNYLGDGVATSNLAGRTLADLIVRADTERVHLPIVDHRSRRWELEPLRFVGVNAAVAWPLVRDGLAAARPRLRRGTP